MRADPQSALMPAIASRRPGLGNATVVVLILLGVLALYWRTTLSMAAIWERSANYTHGFVIVPIFLYLLWRKRDEFAAAVPRPWYPALLGLLAAGATWLVAELVNVAVVAQFAMIAMIPLAVWTVLGTRAATVIAFPLAFLFFAVPFGDFLVPTLMDRTADAVIVAIRGSGVPVYREGNYFMIPSGRWSVVEACSGLRYLIASFMVGSLFAYLTYRSTLRRVAFVATALVVAVVANWLRAYIIVMLGHLTSNRVAAGADHLVYGWVFFGIVMAALFWTGARFAEADEPAPVATTTPVPPERGGSSRHLAIAALMAFALAAIWPALDAVLASGSTPRPVSLALVDGREGWHAAADELPWRPDVSGARAVLQQTFAKDERQAGLFVALFRDQSPEAKAVTSQNQLVNTENKYWKRIGGGAVSTELGGRSFEARTAIVSNEKERLVAWQWFWVDGRTTSSEYVAKLYEAVSKLSGRGDPVAWVVVFTPMGESEAAARQTLEAFVADMRAPVEGALAKAAAQ